MRKEITTFLKEKVERRHVRMAAFAVLGTALGAFLMLVFISNPLIFQKNFPLSNDATNNEVEVVGEILPKSLPEQLRIPAINLGTSFEAPLGLNEDRTIEVPDGYEKVGWYQYGPTPGELGPAVILGHVDSYQGPAVFFSLGQLKPGDSVYIDREDGMTAEFVVTGLERYNQSGFPRELVYGDINHAGLRLVTCTGTFDHGKQVYSHNLVVYAALKGTSTSDSL